MLKRSKNIIFISIGLHSEKSRIIEMEMGPSHATTTKPANQAKQNQHDPIRFELIRFDPIQSDPFSRADSWRKGSERIS